MPDTDVFAYGKSGLDRFLFAEIGIEQNGSALTVLSFLARSGVDPWQTAAQWAKAPPARVVEWLAADIALLPLAREAIDAAHETASRLVQLLPSQGPSSADAASAGRATPPRWGPLILLAGSIAISLAVTLAASPYLDGLASHHDHPPPGTSPPKASR